MQNELEVIKTVPEPFSLEKGALTSKDLQRAQLTTPALRYHTGKWCSRGFIINVFFTSAGKIDNSPRLAIRTPLPRVISPMFRDLIWTPGIRV